MRNFTKPDNPQKYQGGLRCYHRRGAQEQRTLDLLNGRMWITRGPRGWTARKRRYISVMIVLGLVGIIAAMTIALRSAFHRANIVAPPNQHVRVSG